ncbi:putative pantetheine-phosphate adenylyltransferase [Clavispora lusitaniae]|uniref:Pantetheine-phosphate adenylyltransferase n=1 Tax=Clavispora lusitaniae TaxID=36911 RepID=A0AA91PWQ8_CLALS|nr:putative pantetheine-phosphate adenylyltransferase [Clavispora lusitaniae]
MALFLIRDPLHQNYSKFFDSCFNLLPLETSGIHVLVGTAFPDLTTTRHVLSTLYAQLRDISTKHGFPPELEIDVLLRPSGQSYKYQYCVKGEFPDPPAHIVPIDAETEQCEVPIDNDPKDANGKKAITAVGGTFDHIHDGHKILLQTAVLYAQKHVIVGVTGPKLLQKKKYAEMLQSLPERINNVCKLLQLHLPSGVSFSIYEINDVCGPTGFVRDIDILVTSQETAKGAEFVNKYRKEQGFSSLEVVEVGVVGGDGSDNWSGKLSSTDFREREWRKLHS